MSKFDRIVEVNGTTNTLTINGVTYERQYIAEVIEDMLSAEGSDNTEENRMSAMTTLNITSYLTDITKEQQEMFFTFG